MKKIQVRFHPNSQFLKDRLPRDSIFYAFKNEDQPKEDSTILIVEFCDGWRNQHIVVNNESGISAGGNFIVDLEVLKML